MAPRLGVEGLEDRTVPSTFTVLNLADSGDGSLRTAIFSAESCPGADVIQFANQVRGAITLTTGELLITTDLTINGPGANRLTVSGNDASRAFRVIGGADASSAITVGISNLTVAHGRATEGGGINNSGFSDLTLSRVVLTENVAIGTASTDARGGGASVSGSGSTLSIVDSLVVGNSGDGRVNATRGSGGGLTAVSGGHLNVVNTTVAENRAFGGRIDISGAGGGISFAFGSSATVSDSVIRDNRAIGAVGGGSGHGGGILASGTPSSLVLNHSVLTRNHAIGGDGALGRGQAFSGAIDVRLGAHASISDSVLTENRAIAGSGGLNTANDLFTSTALGGAISCGVGSPTGSLVEVTRCTLRGNQAIGGNNGTHTGPNLTDVGSAHGGAIFNARGSEVVIRDSAILGNKAVGGTGNTGNGPVGFVGTATGGGVDNSNSAGGTSEPAKLAVINSILAGNEAIGGTGNTSSSENVFLNAGLGGGIANNLGGTTDVTNSLVTLNQARGGSGGNGLGGGIFNDANSDLSLRTSTINLNRANGGPNDGQGIGGGVYNSGTVAIDTATLILANDADEHDDCFGCP